MKKYYDVEENKEYTIEELKELYNTMKTNEEIEEESFKEWLEISLEPSSCFLIELK